MTHHRHNAIIVREVLVRSASTVSARPFDTIVAALSAMIGHPQMDTFRSEVTSSGTPAEFEQIVRRALGPSGLMEFTRFDAGALLHKSDPRHTPRMLRVLVGNPLIMIAMARSVPEAAAYAPVTILLDERADGVHLSYDLMSSLIAPYADPDALEVAEQLDRTVIRVLETVAR